MFSKSLRSYLKTVGLRLAAWYAVIFVAGVLFLFSLGYLFLSSSLQEQDRRAILLKAGELSTRLQSEGVGALENELRLGRKFKQPDPFFIRLAGSDNRTIFLLLPYQWAEFDIQAWEARSPAATETWFTLPAKDKDYALEIASVPALNGLFLQIGKSTHERRRILQSFRKLFTVTMIPVLLFGAGAGAFQAWRGLKPVRQLIHTIRSIDMGRMHARVPNPATGDELEELVLLFNGMMTRIETLIYNMRATLDNVAHDLRTPMTRLRGMAEMALAAEHDPEKAHEALADALEESERILAMLNMLMDISEAESGVMKLDRQPLDPAGLVREIMDLYAHVADEKKVRLESHLEENVLFPADRVRMRQALANLVDNAVKYTSSGGTVTIGTHVEQGEVVLQVEDTGIGIQPQEIDRIWDRLYRGDLSRSQKGLGLGLSMVKAIVTAHHGRVTVESAPGKGACIKLFLPLNDSAPPKAAEYLHGKIR